MPTTLSTFLPGEPQAAVLFGFPVPSRFFLGIPTRHNNLVSPSGAKYQPVHKLTRLQFSQITTVTSISEGTTITFPGSMVGPKPGKKLVLRVQEYLAEREGKSKTIEEREAYQLARNVIQRAYFEECSEPYMLAFCWMYGGSPELIHWKRDYYRAWMLRETLPVKPTLRVADRTYNLPPRKPVSSVSVPPIAKGVAGGR